MRDLEDNQTDVPHESEDNDYLMSDVICDDHELLYLHTCLSEILHE